MSLNHHINQHSCAEESEKIKLLTQAFVAPILHHNKSRLSTTEYTSVLYHFLDHLAPDQAEKLSNLRLWAERYLAPALLAEEQFLLLLFGPASSQSGKKKSLFEVLCLSHFGQNLLLHLMNSQSSFIDSIDTIQLHAILQGLAQTPVISITPSEASSASEGAAAAEKASQPEPSKQEIFVCPALLHQVLANKPALIAEMMQVLQTNSSLCRSLLPLFQSQAGKPIMKLIVTSSFNQPIKANTQNLLVQAILRKPFETVLSWFREMGYRCQGADQAAFALLESFRLYCREKLNFMHQESRTLLNFMRQNLNGAARPSSVSIEAESSRLRGALANPAALVFSTAHQAPPEYSAAVQDVTPPEYG